MKELKREIRELKELMGQRLSVALAPTPVPVVAVDLEDRNNIPLTFEEKRNLSASINKLEQVQLRRVIDMINAHTPLDCSGASDEIEMDIDSLTIPLQRQLQKLCRSALTASKRKKPSAPRKSPAAKRARGELTAGGGGASDFDGERARWSRLSRRAAARGCESHSARGTDDGDDCGQVHEFD